MSLNIVTKSDAPVEPYPAHASCINIKLIPHILYGLWMKGQKYYWTSASEWTVARSLLAEQGAAILMDCSLEVTNAIDRLYNLVDTRLAGNVRSVTGTGTSLDPFVYDPPLEQAAAYMDGLEGSALYYGAINLSAWQNLLGGEHSSDWYDAYSLKAQIQELIEQDTADDADIAELLADMELLLALLA